MKVKKTILLILAFGIALCLLCGLAVLGINAWVKGSVSDAILSEENAAALQDVDCIIVLGCQVRDDGSPSHMLEDRLRRSVSLYKLGAAPKLLPHGLGSLFDFFGSVLTALLHNLIELTDVLLFLSLSFSLQCEQHLQHFLVQFFSFRNGRQVGKRRRLHLDERRLSVPAAENGFN